MLGLPFRGLDGADNRVTASATLPLQPNIALHNRPGKWTILTKPAHRVKNTLSRIPS